ncbi:CvpA family protein [Desulfosporosinus sp. PR]|uniref:CvpA family protein n=1 Tax=Candidatus Desulfosporosinus nitrosoreducens TaxID=3401928 RepID=UPI0027F1F919|nr:CvpA family protein [Desulfosporosinus sp. PR]MDQ7092476.1 CvpA family protein [Desulfosporosinus sp. PR]
MNLIDVLILGFILFGALSGYRRGLLTSIVNFLSNLIGFLIASREYSNALHWLEQYFPLQQWLEPIVYRIILPLVQSKASTLQQQVLGNILGALPEEWRSIFASVNITGNGLSQSIEQLTQRLAGVLTERILGLVAFGLVFYGIVVLIQFIVSLLLRPFGHWGSSINRGGGLFFGGISALIGLAVLAGLLSPLSQLGMSGGFVTLLHNSTGFPYLVKIFNAMDQAFSAQLSEKLLDPLIKDKGTWF